jgi:hypothetical protein
MNITPELDQIKNLLSSYSIGVQNIYDEFQKIKESISIEDIESKCKLLKKATDVMEKLLFAKELKLDFHNYPLNTLIEIRITTNFGEISYGFDYPPISSFRIGEVIQGCYESLIDELCKTHEGRGGKYLGEYGFGEFLEMNGKTIIKKNYMRSERLKNIVDPIVNK